MTAGRNKVTLTPERIAELRTHRVATSDYGRLRFVKVEADDWAALLDLAEECLRLRAAAEPEASPFASESEAQRRDRDWCLAFAQAVGTDSGLRAPLTPDALLDCLRLLLKARGTSL